MNLQNKSRLLQTLRFVVLYVTLVVLFVLSKPLFMWVQPQGESKDTGIVDVLQVILHGLPLDFATAGYVSALVWLGLGLGIWLKVKGWRVLFRIYAVIISTVLAMTFVGNACLYAFWHTPLDGTVWNYLSQPQGIIQSVSVVYALVATLAIVLVGVILYGLLTSVFLPAKKKKANTTRRVPIMSNVLFTLMWLIGGGLLFLGIRGGIGKGTANVGMVYYSSKPFLNHAAVNPLFSLVQSSLKSQHHGVNAQCFGEDERARLFSMLGYNTESVDSEPLLTTKRPNVVIILMEGCGGEFVHAVDSTASADITPNLNRIAAEGVVFTHVYANSFRTDRGTVCALSGFPSFPDLSVMKEPRYCEKLPSIAASLKRNGYATSFLYGGDANFTNTRGYLQSTGYDKVDGDEAFPASVRRTHNWGVTDRITLDTLYHRITRMPQHRPWHIGMLTLASHEPWGVPYERIKGDEVANAMAYLDHCIGEFVSRLKNTPQWENTLIVLLPDHGIPYGRYTNADDERKDRIPVIFTGGAVKEHRVIGTLCNQTDLAATLLGQLGVEHHDFKLSRDVLSATYTHPLAVHSWPEGIWLKDASGITVLNVLNKPVSVMREAPKASQWRQKAVKAFYQTSYKAIDALNKK